MASHCRRAALCSIALAGAACTHWQTQHVAPEQGFAARTPAAVRLVLMDGTMVWLNRPTLTDSTFVGTSSDTLVRVPRSRVRTWSVQRPGASPEAKTAAAGLGVAALLYLVTFKPLGD